jgi:histidinol phosphatase-like PHP family hydrolase
MIKIHEQMNKAAKENNIAIEINNRYRIPSPEFIKRVKDAGAKFTIGTNNADSNFSGVEYTREMIKQCNLTEEDFFLPANKQQDG